MYLHEPNQLDIIKKQFRFKLNANAASFTILILIQIFALLFSLPSQSNTSYFNENSYITMFSVSNTSHIIFMLFWTLSIGFMLANRLKWDEAFAFVTTRLTHHLSNLLFILFTSLVTGLIASLTGPALRLLANLRYEEIHALSPTIIEAPSHFILQFITATAYALLLLMVGYAIGSFLQSSKAYGGIFIITIFISIFFIIFILGFGVQMIGSIIMFLFIESFLPFFLMKVIGLSTILFCFSIFITSRVEVRNS